LRRVELRRGSSDPEIRGGCYSCSERKDHFQGKVRQNSYLFSRRKPWTQQAK
jgi:hypothetical protein